MKWRAARWLTAAVVVVAAAIAGIYLDYGQKREVWREVWRDSAYIWAYNARSVRVFGPAEGCGDKPYVEVWLNITNRERGNYDRIRTHLAANSREYRFTDSLGYDADGMLGEL